MNINLSFLLAVGSGGFLGAISRYLVGIYVTKHFPHELPLATLTVNIVGSFIIGLLIGIFVHFTPNESLRLFLITGFLGALTTYSTFAIESYFLLNSSLLYALVNIILNLVGTIATAGIGYKLVNLFLR